MNNAQPAQAAPALRHGNKPLSVTTEPKSERRPFWSRLIRKSRDRERMMPLYEAVVAAGRDPFWYREGGVPDTVTGRFDMIAAIMALVLIRYEAEEGEGATQASVWLTENFIADMDESLHQLGVGEYVVGKHVGNMMGALGGRLGAFRQAVQDGDYLTPVRRNIYHETPPSEVVAAQVAARLERFAATLRATAIAELTAGGLPRP